MSRLTKVAVIIPLLGLMLLMARAEFAIRSGPTWQVSIEGYDPRDLLHGRYLRFRYRLNWQGPDTCGEGDRDEDERTLDRGCCLCLTRDNREGVDPPVRQVWCDDVDSCDGWLRADSVAGGQRYFVPEDRARELEAALRDRDAALELTCGPNGDPAIRDLLLDGRPWRDVIGD